MTGYERIMGTLRGEVIVPTPTMLHSFLPAAREQNLTQSQYRSSGQTMARAHVDFARKYGLDGILLEMDTCVEAHAMGVPVDFPDDEPARVIGPVDGGIDRCIEAMDPDKLINDQRVMSMLEAVHLMKEEAGGELLIRGNADQAAYSLAMLSVGMIEFMMMLTDEQSHEKIHQLLDRSLSVHLRYHKMLAEAGADITSFGDSSCGPDLISRDMYREFSLPYHKRLADELAGADIMTVCHICGNLDLIMEDVVDVGFAAIEIDYKTNIQRAAEVAKGKSVIFGPIDPSGVFYSGHPEMVRKETEDVLRHFPHGGLVIGAGCALPPGVPEENIQSFMEAVERKTYDT